MGIRIAMDHYGASFGTLNEMKDFPVHNIKFDGEFLKNMDQNPVDASLGSMIIAAAHNLGIRVTAAGVEKASQLDFLRKNDCDDAQGGFLSPPLTTDQLTQFLSKPVPMRTS